ncbi:MAG: hypothetical protein L0Y39_03280 [Methylococcaceae bacterium]|nr:hypothetical protein [Methylococcaceae bacterium]
MAEPKGQARQLGQTLVRRARLTIRIEHRWRQSRYRSDVYRQRLNRIRNRFLDALNQGAQILASTWIANQCQRLLGEKAVLWTFPYGQVVEYFLGCHSVRVFVPMAFFLVMKL